MSIEKILTKQKCPFCQKYIIIKEIKHTIEEPVRGVYEKKIVIEKDKQQHLGE